MIRLGILIVEILRMQNKIYFLTKQILDFMNIKLIRCIIKYDFIAKNKKKQTIKFKNCDIINYDIMHQHQFFYNMELRCTCIHACISYFNTHIYT